MEIFEYQDKMLLKINCDEKQVRIVPYVITREGEYIVKGSILMLSYLNIGTYIKQETMVDNRGNISSFA